MPVSDCLCQSRDHVAGAHRTTAGLIIRGTRTYFSATRSSVMATLISVPAKFVSTAHTTIAATAFAVALLAGWLGGKWKELCINSVARESDLRDACPTYPLSSCTLRGRGVDDFQVGRWNGFHLSRLCKSVPCYCCLSSLADANFGQRWRPSPLESTLSHPNRPLCRSSFPGTSPPMASSPTCDEQ